jgi:cobalt/nickel transport system permease protein
MHIPDGLVPPVISATGFALALGATVPLIRKDGLLTAKMTRISLVAAVVFVSSLIHIPVALTTVHLTFAPLAGILLGPVSFVAVFLAVFLQWMLLGHGGITTLGLNTLTMGTAALLSWFLFCRISSLLPATGKHAAFPAVLAAVSGALLKVVLGGTILLFSWFPGETFFLLILFHLPVILGEGAVAGLAVYYLSRHFRARGEAFAGV